MPAPRRNACCSCGTAPTGIRKKRTNISSARRSSRRRSKSMPPWKEGPELLAKADGVVLFVSEGARWLNANPERLAAFQACAKRKAGLAVLHWGMGSKDAKNIQPFVDLFGGCHGGP